MNNGKNAPSGADPDADTRMPKWATKLSIGWGEDCPLQLLHEVDSLQPGGTLPTLALKCSSGAQRRVPYSIFFTLTGLAPFNMRQKLTLGVVVAQNRKTPGVLIVEGNKKPVKWAVSGHSMPDPAATTKVLSNRFWTSTGRRHRMAFLGVQGRN